MIKLWLPNEENDMYFCSNIKQKLEVNAGQTWWNPFMFLPLTSDLPTDVTDTVLWLWSTAALTIGWLSWRHDITELLVTSCATSTNGFRHVFELPSCLRFTPCWMYYSESQRVATLEEHKMLPRSTPRHIHTHALMHAHVSDSCAVILYISWYAFHHMISPWYVIYCDDCGDGD